MKYHENGEMDAKKFATQIDAKVLEDLKAFAKQTERSISKVVNEAVKSYIEKAQVRPAFKSAMDEVLDDHAELLKRLAR